MRGVLMTLRGFYLATGLSGGVLVPYLSLWLSRDGLRSDEIGQVMSIGTLVAILTQPIWGMIVDRYQWTRPTLLLSTLVPGVLALLYNIPLFAVIALVNVLWTVFSTPQTPIADTYAVTAARAHGTSYGTIRCFGSLGFAVGAWAAGLYLTWFPVSLLWIPYVGSSLLAAVLAWRLPMENVEVSLPGKIGQGLRDLLQHRPFLVFLVGGLLVSQTLAAFNTYFALAFRMIGGSMSETGLAFLLASSMNVPAMLVAARVMRHLGREYTMLLAAGFYMIRWAVQAAVPSPAVAIAIQALHGVSFGFFYVAAVDFVARAAPAEIQATGQSVFNMVCVSLAGVLGNLLNGYLLRLGGPTLMYWSCAVSSMLAVGCFLYVAKHGAEPLHRRKPVASTARQA